MLNQIHKFLLLTSLALLFFFAPKIYANHIPAPTGYVNDFAGVLTADQKANLESLLKSFEQETTNEIVVATVKSLNGGDITDFTVRTFEEWKIGKKGKDNGVLFLAAIEDKKMRIEVGYGAEGYLTDGEAGEIIRNIIAPRFKSGDYHGGISDGVLAIKDHLSKNPAEETRGKTKVAFWSVIKDAYGSFGMWVFYIPIIIIYLMFSYLGAFLARSKEVWLGAIIGAVMGGGLGWFIGNTLFNVLVSVIIGTGVGYLLDDILSSTYQKRLKDGLGTSWWSSGGGFSTGSGGGFGGFGGGGSGGGGASGGW